VSRAVGAPVHIRDFSLEMSLITPSLNIDDIIVESAPSSQSPLLQADRLKIGLQIVSMLKRKWYFSNITIDRPVLRIYVNQAGTNLPGHITSGIFDIGIRNVSLRQGEFYYNDRGSTLDAALRDVDLQSQFDPQLQRYTGRFRYANGQIRFRDLSPIVHSLESDFEATPGTFSITHCIVTTSASRVIVAATLKDYVHPGVTGTYEALLDAADLSRILHISALPSGVVRLTGSAQLQSDPYKPLLKTLSLDGNMNSSALQIHTTTINTIVRDISADYLLHEGDIDLRNLRAQVLGGALSGSYSIHDVTGERRSNLIAALRNADLSAIQAISNASVRKQFRVTGTANLTLDVTWQNASDTLVARGAAALKGNLAPLESADLSKAVPVDGSLHVAYSAPAAEVTFAESYLRMPKTTVTLSGTVSRRQSLQIRVQSDELHELEAAANAFGLIRKPVELYGAASFKGTVHGFTAQPQIAGQLSSPALKIRGAELRALSATLDAGPSHLALRNVDVRTADNVGRLTLDANVALDGWSYTELSPLQIDLNAARLNVAQLLSLADSKIPVTGILSARVSLVGPLDNLRGQGVVTLNQATVVDESVPSLTLNFRGDGDSIRAHLDTLLKKGGLQGDVTYFPKQRAYDGQVRATNINVDQLRSFRAKGIHVSGVLNMTAKGVGTLDDPGLDVTADISQPQIDNSKLSDISIAATIANHVADIVLDTQTPNALRGSARVELTGGYLVQAAVDTAPISLAPLLALYLPAQAADMGGQTELHARINGPLKNPSAIDGQITLPIVSIAYRGEVQLANAQPIHLDYRKGVLTLRRTGFQGTGTNLQLEGSFPVSGTGSFSVIAAGQINLQLVQIIDPDYSSSGEIEFEINGSGKRINPDFKGQIKVVNASFSGSGIPVALREGNGILHLVDGRLDIDKFQGSINNGTTTVRGNVTYRPSVKLNLVMAGDGIRLAHPAGVRGSIDTNLTLTGALGSAALKGQVRLNELSFSQPFDIEGVLQNLEQTRTPPSGAARNLSFDVVVHSTEELNLSSHQLTLNGAANLRLRGTAAKPVLLGSISLNGGELLFRGDRYILKPGTVDFVDPSGFKPRLNIAVETRVQQYNIRLLFRGPIDELRTTFSSEPPLPPADTINLLIFGKTNQPLTTDSTGNLGAVSLLAAGVTNTLTNRLQAIAGISQLSVDPVLDNDAQSSTVGVTVRQRVTANLFVTFTSDPSSTTRKVVEVEYQATPGLSLNGVFNQNGGFAADIRIRKTW
jgi:translocation and assembly module TamB